CGEIIPQLARDLDLRVPNDEEIFRRLSKLPLKSAKDGRIPLTPETARSLAMLPRLRRDRLCYRIAEALALTEFSRDMNGAFDLLTLSANNPNLPHHRRMELLEKQRALKEQVDLTVSSKKDEAVPFGEISSYITREGATAQSEATRDALDVEASDNERRDHGSRFNDCADGIYCGSGGGP
ncbi:MAG: hypothetical protein AAB425_15665, partial [Bdellovibrionota bacterium]